MKKRFFFAGFILVLAAEIIALTVFALQTPEITQDAVAVNEIIQSVKRDLGSMSDHENASTLDYVVLDNDGKLIYKTKAGLSENINAAIVHRDTVLDVVIENAVAGKIIVYNDGASTLQSHKQKTIAVLSIAIALQFLICIGYGVYIHVRVIRPFRKLKGFAERVACGNLDIPLEMDRQNLFGAFTESFDIMRSELKKARISEAQAQQSKKELVAKLSHDIKTPVASIKAISEVGVAVAKNEKDMANYTQIISKADQINTLVTNLFTATLEELQQLSVSPADMESRKIAAMLLNADYLKRAVIPALPDCLIYADGLRLQQVFDNIFANAYKYAKTDISVTIEKSNTALDVIIEDFGGGVADAELSVLKEKFKRGSNAENTEGAGLGLYISDYFMKEMRGELIVENGAHGLKATVRLALSGTI